MEPHGGAISRVDPTATAYPHRGSAFGFGIQVGWDDAADDEKHLGWARSLYEEMRKHLGGGVYSNYLAFDDADRIESPSEKT